MATMKHKLEQALASHFKGAELKLKGFSRGKRVVGTLVWKGFAGEPQIDRQVKLREVVDDALLPDERSKVSFILTVTPTEFASITNDH